MKVLAHALFALGFFTAAAPAVIIGVETFDTDGLIADQAGGIGFFYDLFDGAITDTISDWDNVGGTPSVVSGGLLTQESSAKREYNGNIEGVGNGANDGQDDHERSGALRGVGAVFYKFDITRSSGSTWSGISSYDFGAERIFFGVPSSFAANDEAGIQISGVGNTGSGVTLLDDETYTMVAVLDFDSDLLGLFVNPDSSDEWDAEGGSADTTLAYTNTNWSTAARFGSGGATGTTWDNLTIATTPEEVGLLGLKDDEELIQITAIEIDSDTGDITVTWTSEVGRTYRVETSTDLQSKPADSWSEYVDIYPSAGATAERTSLQIPAEDPVLAGINRLFVRVVELSLVDVGNGGF